jgi:hypothetical protein
MPGEELDSEVVDKRLRTFCFHGAAQGVGCFIGLFARALKGNIFVRAVKLVKKRGSFGVPLLFGGAHGIAFVWGGSMSRPLRVKTACERSS